MENSPFIHILAGFPESAPETTIYKARIKTELPGARVLFTHQDFKPGDIIAPGIFLRLITDSFPDNTVHVCILHPDDRFQEKYLHCICKSQVFFIPDNGLMSIAFPGEEVSSYRIPGKAPFPDVFLHAYLPYLIQLAKNPDRTGEIEEKPRKLMLQQPPLTGNIYKLSVVYNDESGNAYLNIQKDEFERITTNKKFILKIGMRETIEKISVSHTEVPNGSRLAKFGFGDMLQIGVNGGSAKQYLGLQTGKIVMLEIVS